jgi:hypothetical protein
MPIAYVTLYFPSVDASHWQILHETRDRQETIDYLSDLRNMRKVSLPVDIRHPWIMTETEIGRSTGAIRPFSVQKCHYFSGLFQTPDASALEKLSIALSSANPSPIHHHVWTEQPEDIPTCIALAPNRKEKPIRKALDKSSCRLWRSD